MDNITFSILRLPLTHYHMCMLLRLCLLEINPCRSSYSFRVIYLCRLNKSSEKTYIWLTIFMYSFNYILYSYAGCLFSVRVMSNISHINQAFRVFQVALCVRPYQIHLCNLWQIFRSFYISISHSESILFIRKAFLVLVTLFLPYFQANFATNSIP